jgi:hypothetical protein
MAKVLVLGHGWWCLRNMTSPRCSPMDIEKWDELVTHNVPSNLTFIDYDEEQEPDIVEDVGNDWGSLIKEPQAYDYVIDAITHIPIKQRFKEHYWNGVITALKDGGTYIGWNNNGKNSILERRLVLNKKEVVAYAKHIS